MIRQQTSRANQVLPADFAFSRASLGYNTKGKLYMPNQLRLESSIYGGSVALVEEATGNSIPVDKQKFVGWTVYGGATVTLTQNQVMPEWGTADATRIQISGGDRIYKYGIQVLTTSVSGQSYTTTLYIRNNGSTDMMVNANITYLPTTITPGQITKLVVTCVGNGTNGLGITFYAKTVEETVDITVWRLQTEAKPYPTSFIETSRAAESLTMPTTGLSPTEGTIEGIFEVTDVVKRIGVGSFANIFSIFKTDSTSALAIRLNHDVANGLWYLRTYNDAGIATQVSIADSLTPNGFYYYKIPWAVSEARVEFWDLVTRAKIATGVISTPNLPSGFNSYGYLGGLLGYNFADARFGKHRLSSIARTDDPDFDNLMPRDGNTTALMDFDDITFRAAQNIVI